MVATLDRRDVSAHDKLVPVRMSGSGMAKKRPPRDGGGGRSVNRYGAVTRDELLTYAAKATAWAAEIQAYADRMGEKGINELKIDGATQADRGFENLKAFYKNVGASFHNTVTDGLF